jgi:hypothetical protein
MCWRITIRRRQRRTATRELKPLKLNAQELRQIELFLRALSGGIAAPLDLLRAPAR